MKHPLHLTITRLAWASMAILTSVIALPAGFAQSTAFTYQGRLNDGTSPANGNYDLRFAVFDAAAGGAQQGATVTSLGNVVSNGLFLATLDFGNQFSGANRWLEIAVRTNGAASFSLLSPRQALTPTPYAITAGSVVSGGLSAGTYGNAVTLNNAANQFTGLFSGNGSGLNNLNAASLTGTLPGGVLPANVGLLNANQSWTGANIFSQSLKANGIVESTAGGFKFPDGKIQTSVATRIIASVNMEFSQDDRSGWTHVEALGDDTTVLNIPLGFTYTGFGINTPTISLSSNGVLFFGQNASTEWVNGPLPSSISSDAMLFFFWDDLQDFGTGEYLEYATFGTAPGRVFNLYFRSRLHDTAVCGSNAVNLMISIHESSGLIKVTYSGFSGCANIRGSGATFGFQTPGGANAAAFMVGYNAPVLDDNATNQTMCFHPPN